jgi:hypothetical protein
MINRWWWVAISIIMTISVIAQGTTCPTLQDNALATISEFCAEQSPHTLCYGNPTTSVTFLEEPLPFAQSGDSIPLTSIDWFSTSLEANTWGATRAFLQAYPSNSLQAQPATMILFGNVTLFNQGTEGITIQTAEIEITSIQGANIRKSPITEASVLEPVLRGTILKASGVSEDTFWVRVHMERDEVGWVNVTAISGDYTALPTVPSDEEPDMLILPLQAFNFQSGVADATCDDVPSSGVLLQASTDGNPTEFYINGVTLQLNGTAFLQAQPNTGLLVHVTDGTGQILSLESEQTIEVGYVSRVFLDVDKDNLLYPIETPTIPLVYDYQSLINLPIELLANPTRVGMDIYTLITPRPIGGESPIAGMALNAPCKFTVGQSGANIRSEPNSSGSIIAVMGYRESVEPIGRTIGAGSYPWWKLDEHVWIRVDVTVTGGDCASVPTIKSDG